MRALVTGAAGYIGSHVARALEENGHEAVRLDDLSTGHELNLEGRPCVRASTHDRDAVAGALEGVDAVVHLAAFALVGESVEHPERYWRNNVAGGLTLLEEMARAGVRRMVFSSTCAVYGVPDEVPITEATPQRPANPYGASKAACERMLTDFAVAHELRAISLRYFNAAGAHESGAIGERREHETHLIPNVLAALAGGGTLTLHGDDYPTRDGTCVRDYVDVRDIAAAHLLALDALGSREPGHEALNLGTGEGFTVLEVIRACEELAGVTASIERGPRRPGDPPELVADASLARERLGWQPQHDLRSMIASALAFDRNEQQRASEL